MRILTLDKPALWSNDWFKAWQFLFQIAINSPHKGLREEVRNRLGIHLDRQIPIARLLKNSFAIKVGEGEYQETFYGRNVFAHSIQRELMWLWQTIHKWDVNFANYISPRLNLGFDTLTSYSNGHPETVSCDGVVSYGGGGNSWSTIHDSATGTTYRADWTLLKVMATYDGSDYFINRCPTLFDTSALTSQASISATTYSILRSSTIRYYDDSAYLNIVSCDIASNTDIVAADYNKFGTTVFGYKTIASMTSFAAYYSMTLNADGRANISKTSISKFGLRIDLDVDNTEPIGNNQVTIFAGEYGVGSAPAVIVTYTIVPITFVPQIII